MWFVESRRGPRSVSGCESRSRNRDHVVVYSTVIKPATGRHRPIKSSIRPKSAPSLFRVLQWGCSIIPTTLEKSRQFKTNNHRYAFNASSSNCGARQSSFASNPSQVSPQHPLAVSLSIHDSSSLGQLVIDALATRLGVRMSTDRRGIIGSDTVSLSGIPARLTLFKSSASPLSI